MLVAAYPGAHDSKHYLRNVIPEAEAIAAHFQSVIPLYDDQATPDAVVAASRGQEVIHLGCHGLFDPDHPDQSGLLLAGGWLTVQRILSDLRLQGTSLVTLGACVSARVDLSAGDELVGLTQATLTAGAPVVVASQWTVNDAATRALFTACYAAIADGQPPAAAMRQAQQAVRSIRRWEHPYYWSAFGVYGLAHQAATNGQSVPSRLLDQVRTIADQQIQEKNEEEP